MSPWESTARLAALETAKEVRGSPLEAKTLTPEP
jgi:hypothetical protein